MDGSRATEGGLNAAPVRESRPETTADEPDGREGGSPFLTLAGFTGPLDHLLALARGQKIDLSAIPLTALLDQLTTSLRQAPAAVPLGQKANWVVMAAWLVQLRARLLLPPDAPAGQDAVVEADQLRTRLVALEDMQALAGWLEARPQLGHDVFAQGRPEGFGGSVDAAQAVDGIEFLWASLALFDDEEPPDTTTVYRPVRHALHSVAQARERIMRVLQETPEGALFEQLLPEPPEVADHPLHGGLQRRSGWASTLVASLELARQGDVVLAQAERFQPIHVAPASHGIP